MARDPLVNIQPETDNPHDMEEMNDEVELDPDILDQARDHATSEFERNFEDEILRAAYVSKKLESSYERDGIYLMAEIGPSGIFPVALSDGNQFLIDEDYDPEIVEEGLSPLGFIEQTGYDEELGGSIAQYETRDLNEEFNVESLADDWGDQSLDKLEETYIVAPGMQDLYREGLEKE